ncbi:hypothetical protein QCN27_18005 [Cereibacter sp. SYSU M97828]|nr:hypothetical protein [Cereibacter flavus]
MRAFFTMMRNGQPVVDRAPCDIAGGDLIYKWKPEDTARVGVMQGEFIIVYADNGIETDPVNGYIQITVQASLSPLTPLPELHAPTLTGGGIGADGADLVIAEPEATGSPVPTVVRTVTRDGAPVDVVGNRIVGAAPGAYVVTWTATNGVVPDAVLSRTITVAQPEPEIIAPYVISQPALELSGDDVLVTRPTYGGSEPLDIAWAVLRDGVNVTGEVVNGRIAGARRATDVVYSTAGSATNVAGEAVADVASLLVEAAVVLEPPVNTDLPEITVSGETTPDGDPVAGGSVAGQPGAWTGSPMPTVATVIRRQLGTTGAVETVAGGLEQSGAAKYRYEVQDTAQNGVGEPVTASSGWTKVFIGPPAKFSSAQWSLAQGNAPHTVAVTISALPDDGGSPITALNLMVGSGERPSVPASVGTHQVVIPGAAGSRSMHIYATNDAGLAGEWSSLKTVVVPEPEASTAAAAAFQDSVSVYEAAPVAAANRQRYVGFLPNAPADGQKDYVLMRAFLGHNAFSNATAEYPNISFRLEGQTTGVQGEIIAGSNSNTAGDAQKNQHMQASKYSKPPAGSKVGSYFLTTTQGAHAVAGWVVEDYDFAAVAGYQSRTGVVELTNVPACSIIIAGASTYNGGTSPLTWSANMTVDERHDGTLGSNRIRMEFAHSAPVAGGAITITATGAQLMSVVVVPPGADGGAVEPADPGEAFSIQQNGVTFHGEGATNWGLTEDGQIGIASDPEGIRMDAISPGVGTENGLTHSGVQIDPELGYGYNRAQAFDQRSKDNLTNQFFKQEVMATFPTLLARGQVITKAIGIPGPFREGTEFSNDTRVGIVEKYVAAIAADRKPVKGDVLAPVSKTLRKPGQFYVNFDFDAIVAGLPNIAITGAPNIDVELILTSLEKFNPVTGFMNSTIATSGYEPLSPHLFGVTRNYGKVSGSHIHTLVILMGSNLMTLAQKRRGAVALASMGVQWDGYGIAPDGGHGQYQQLPILMKRLWLGEPLLTIPRGNMANYSQQYFLHTAATIEQYYQPHDNAIRFHLTRRRTIKAVSGSSITCSFSKNAGDAYDVCFKGMLMVREGFEGTQRTRLSTEKLGTISTGAQDRTFTIAGQPSTPFKVGDVIYFIPDYTINVNDPDWHIGYEIDGVMSSGSPAVNARYRDVNTPQAFAFAIKLMGVSIPMFDPLVAYVERVKGGNYPSAEHKFPGVDNTTINLNWIDPVWNQHWETVKNTPPRYTS